MCCRHSSICWLLSGVEKPFPTVNEPEPRFPSPSTPGLSTPAGEQVALRTCCPQLSLMGCKTSPGGEGPLSALLPGLLLANSMFPSPALPGSGMEGWDGM